MLSISGTEMVANSVRSRSITVEAKPEPHGPTTYAVSMRARSVLETVPFRVAPLEPGSEPGAHGVQ